MPNRNKNCSTEFHVTNFCSNVKGRVLNYSIYLRFHQFGISVSVFKEFHQQLEISVTPGFELFLTLPCWTYHSHKNFRWRMKWEVLKAIGRHNETSFAREAISLEFFPQNTFLICEASFGHDYTQFKQLFECGSKNFTNCYLIFDNFVALKITSSALVRSNHGNDSEKAAEQQIKPYFLN